MQARLFLTRAAAVPGARISVSRLATARSRHNVRNVSAAAMKDLPVDEVYNLHQGGEYPYLDVRTPEEFVQGHPSGAVNIPVMVKAGFGMAPNPDFVAEVKKVFTDPSKEIIVGCKSGKRSAHACSLIGDAYPNLINNASGFDGWLASGFPVHK